MVGIRHALSIELLTEKYADTGELAILAHFRGDVQVARPAAFDCITGIL